LEHIVDSILKRKLPIIYPISYVLMKIWGLCHLTLNLKQPVNWKKLCHMTPRLGPRGQFGFVYGSLGMLTVGICHILWKVKEASIGI
jgi:hypothetical protein